MDSVRPGSRKDADLTLDLSLQYGCCRSLHVRGFCQHKCSAGARNVSSRSREDHAAGHAAQKDSFDRPLARGFILFATCSGSMHFATCGKERHAMAARLHEARMLQELLWLHAFRCQLPSLPRSAGQVPREWVRVAVTITATPALGPLGLQIVATMTIGSEMHGARTSGNEWLLEQASLVQTGPSEAHT